MPPLREGNIDLEPGGSEQQSERNGGWQQALKIGAAVGNHALLLEDFFISGAGVPGPLILE